MRKSLPILTLAAAVTFATSALAQDDRYPTEPVSAAPAVATGAAVGTVAGVGAFNGWWGATAAGAALPTTVAGSAALGGVAGVGTVALIDAAVEPCRGFAAIFGLNHDQCVDGVYVGNMPRRQVSELRHSRRVVR